MRIRTKLYAGFGAMLLMTLGLGAVAWSRNVALGLCALALLVGTALAIWIARGIDTSIGALRSAMAEIERSRDLGHRVPVEGSDEVAETAVSFNQLMASLRESMSKLAAHAGQVADASGKVTGSAHAVVSASRTQSEAAASTAAAVEELTVSVQQIADSTGETAKIADQASTLSEQGEKVAAEAAQEMAHIADSVKESSRQIEVLSQRSADISGIVKVIKGVADQTNLLALNAAIEAARAGEQGRGFAVVADEVRKLAERTGAATTEIAGLIDTIQGEIHAAVANLETSSVKVAAGVRLAGEVAAALSQIDAGAKGTLDRVNDIDNAAKEQGKASTDIARNVERIVQMTEANTATAEQASATAGHLQQVAGELLQEVAKFKV